MRSVILFLTNHSLGDRWLLIACDKRVEYPRRVSAFMSTDGAGGLVYSTVVNGQHHGALVKIAAGLCLTAFLEIFLVRLLIRWPWRSLAGLDDGTIAFATFLGILQVACVFSAVNKGFGTAPELLSSSSVVATEKLLCVGNFLYIFSLYFGKLSVCIFFRRLSAFHSVWSNALAGLDLVFCLISFLVIAIQTGPRSWLYEVTLADSVVDRWIVIEILSSFFDIVISIFPIYLVRNLQMRQGLKVQVVLLFWLRLPLIIFSALHVLSLFHELRDHHEQIFRSVGSQIYLQVEMAYNLCAATLPCLRLFLTKTQSGILCLVPEIGPDDDDTQMAVAGSASYFKPRRDDEIELMDGSYFSTTTVVADGSIVSDSSQPQISVCQTFDVRTNSAASTVNKEFFNSL